MSLKLYVDSLDEVSENAREFYKEKEDGGFALELATKVVSEQKYNREVNRLTTQVNDLSGRDKWIKPEDHQKVKDDLDAARDESKLDQLVNDRIAELRTEWEGEKTTLTQDRDKFKTNYQNTLLETELAKVAATSGVKSAALPDVMLRARTMFSVDEDGSFVAKGADGKELFEKDGTTPLSVKAWVGNMTKDAPHWFEESRGGGATGNTTNRTVVNNQPKSSVDLYSQGLADLDS